MHGVGLGISSRVIGGIVVVVVVVVVVVIVVVSFTYPIT